jgi:hypothetical protein
MSFDLTRRCHRSRRATLPIAASDTPNSSATST